MELMAYTVDHILTLLIPPRSDVVVEHRHRATVLQHQLQRCQSALAEGEAGVTVEFGVREHSEQLSIGNVMLDVRDAESKIQGDVVDRSSAFGIELAHFFYGIIDEVQDYLIA